MNSGNLLRIAISRTSGGEGLALPAYQTDGAAGLDLLAAVKDQVTLGPGSRELIPTGFAFAIPQGHEAQIRPRSGLAADFGVTILNAPGTIDSDYRGEVKVLLANLGTAPFTVIRGMRIAQMIVTRVERTVWDERTILPKTVRDVGGFGSTGMAGDYLDEPD